MTSLRWRLCPVSAAKPRMWCATRRIARPAVPFDIPTIAVDTHIFRVSNRTKIAPGKTVLEVEKKLMKFVPKEYKQDAHHWLILLGRYTCVARKPRCGSCLIEDLCEFKQKAID